MKKTHVILIILLGIINPLFSQSDFRKGYIIKTDNDTIYGLIDYRGEKANSEKCCFKLKESDEVTNYAPTEILSYRFIDDKYYISKEVIINNTPEIKFLEFLVNGIVDLYYMRDLNGIHYFIEKSGNGIIELKQTEYEVIVNNVRYIKTSKEYIGSLKHFLGDAPNLKNSINDISLSRRSLIKISENYHNQICKDNACIIYEKNSLRLK